MSSVCARCGSAKIIPSARIVDYGRGPTGDLTVEIYENPDALVFKGAHKGILRARICGDCGHAELYVENPAELYAAYTGGAEEE